MLQFIGFLQDQSMGLLLLQGQKGEAILLLPPVLQMEEMYFCILVINLGF